MAEARLLSERPSDQVTVEVNFFIICIHEINSARQEFDCDFYLDCIWRDDRVAALTNEERDFSGGKVWKPELELTNAGEMTKLFENWLVEGSVVTYQTRLRGIVKSAMDLRRFPFDVQRLQLRIQPSDHTADEMVLTMKSGAGGHVSKEVRKMGELGEWRMNGLYVTEERETLEFDGSVYTQLRIDMVVFRNADFYIKRVGLTVGLIWIQSLSSYLIDPNEAGDRLSIGIGLGLTSVAFQFTVLDSLPKVPYLTLLDKYFSCCYVAISVSAIESCVVFRLSDAGYSTSLIWGIDLTCCILSLLFYVCLSAWLMWRGLGFRNDADTDRDGYLSPEELDEASDKCRHDANGTMKVELVRDPSFRPRGT